MLNKEMAIEESLLLELSTGDDRASSLAQKVSGNFGKAVALKEIQGALNALQAKGLIEPHSPARGTRESTAPHGSLRHTDADWHITASGMDYLLEPDEA